eukprot:122618-Amphidinium_carterae.1
MALIRHGSRVSDQARGPHPYESSRSPRSTPRARNEELAQEKVLGLASSVACTRDPIPRAWKLSFKSLVEL